MTKYQIIVLKLLLAILNAVRRMPPYSDDAAMRDEASAMIRMAEGGPEQRT